MWSWSRASADRTTNADSSAAVVVDPCSCEKDDSRHASRVPSGSQDCHLLHVTVIERLRRHSRIALAVGLGGLLVMYLSTLVPASPLSEALFVAGSVAIVLGGFYPWFRIRCPHCRKGLIRFVNPWPKFLRDEDIDVCPRCNLSLGAEGRSK